MAEQVIQLPADSTGKKVRTFEQTVGANVVQHQAFVICDSAGNIVDSLAATPAGTERAVPVRHVGGLPALVGATPTPVTAVNPGVAGRTALDVNIASSSGALSARVTNTFGAAPGAVGTPNTANVANTTVTVACGNAGNATFDMSASAYVGSVTFEGSTDGGTTWATIAATREDGSGTDTTTAYNIGAAFTRMWTIAVPGFTHIRARATAWTSGTATFGVSMGAFLIETAVVATTQVPLNQSVDGAGTPQPFQFAYFNVSTAQTGVSLVAAPAAGRAIRVISYAIVVGVAMNVSLIGPATTLLLPFAANGGAAFAGTLQGPAFQCAAATALTYTTSVAGQATGHICYVVV